MIEELTYEDQMEICVVPEEVHRYKIYFQRENGDSHPSWARIEQGEFKKTIADRSLRVQYSTKEGEDADTDCLLLTIDARSDNDEYIQALPNDNNRVVRITQNCFVVQNTKECILSIDLGNTRTVALLIDKVDEMQSIENNNGINVHYVPMCWNVKEDVVIDSPFESIASFVDTPDNAGFHTECRKSFVKLGSFAVFNNRARDKSVQGKYTLSSPKRYYWDNDCSDLPWYATNYIPSADDRIHMYPLEHSLLARSLAQDFNPNPARLPNSAMLSAMVAELYEQAVYYISSQYFKDKTEDARPRRISKIHITYPSTLTPVEKEKYQRVLKKGIEKISPGIQIEVATDIDEATSVLALYTFSKLNQYNSASFWLTTVGKKCPDSSRAQIAVIDIGGGTTDLSISQVFAANADIVTEPRKATVMLQFRDGVNSAGDDFMLNFLEPVKRKVFDAFSDLDGDPLNNVVLEDFIVKYNSLQDSVKGLKRNFWFDIAIKIAAECDKLLKAREGADSALQEPEILEYELKENSTEWNTFFTQLRMQDFEFDLNTLLKIKIDEDLINNYKEAVEVTFSEVALFFGKAISAHNTDIVLFSGKTSEFYYVQECFKKFIAVPHIETMKDFKVGTWCSGITNEGEIQDSKVSTALGGALYTLRDKGFVTLDFQITPLANRYFWGIVRPNHINFTDNADLFQQERAQSVKIPLKGTLPVYIARRPEYSQTAILSYRVRLKPAALQEHSGGVNNGTTVTIERVRGKLELRLAGVDGTFADDNYQITLNDVECETCNMSNVFGLDDERI